MSLHRALAGLLSSSSTSQARRCLLLRPVTAVRSSPLSTDAAAAKRTQRKNSKIPRPSIPEQENLGFPKDPPPLQKDSPPLTAPKPSEIPWQVKVANSVHLIGSVGVPVQVAVSPDGTYTAVSILVSEKSLDLPRLWIPLIFQGDLAQIAACHLKENDVVYVTGQLSGDAPPPTAKQDEASIQVMVDSVSFVQNIYSKIKDHAVSEEDVGSFSSADIKDNGSISLLWNDLLSNPHKWWDNRSNKIPGFRHKDTGELLLVNELTPEWVLSKLSVLVFNQTPKKSDPKKSDENVDIKDNGSISLLWNDLLANPHKWWDNRSNKIPGFRHKDTGELLLVNELTPEWVLSKLNVLVFNQTPKKSDPKKSDENASTKKAGELTGSLWNDLVKNPHEWWDNRMDKQNGMVKPKYPDFRHKDTLQGLWLSGAPDWVLSKLEGLVFGAKSDRPKQEKNKTEPAKKTENGESWRDLVENPDKWWDNRSKKLKLKSPDFKNKWTGEGLWLSSSTPPWVRTKLPPVKDNQKAAGFKAVTLLS